MACHLEPAIRRSIREAKVEKLPELPATRVRSTLPRNTSPPGEANVSNTVYETKDVAVVRENGLTREQSSESIHERTHSIGGSEQTDQALDTRTVELHRWKSCLHDHAVINKMDPIFKQRQLSSDPGEWECSLRYGELVVVTTNRSYKIATQDASREICRKLGIQPR